MRECGYSKACTQRVYNPQTFCFYHQKVKDRLISPVEEYLSQTELDTLFGGRRRNDGRRLDHYTRS